MPFQTLVVLDSSCCGRLGSLGTRVCGPCLESELVVSSCLVVWCCFRCTAGSGLWGPGVAGPATIPNCWCGFAEASGRPRVSGDQDVLPLPPPGGSSCGGNGKSLAAKLLQVPPRPFSRRMCSEALSGATPQKWQNKQAPWSLGIRRRVTSRILQRFALDPCSLL